jgi:hypothetical protein
VNDRKRAAFLADLAVLVRQVDHPDFDYKIAAVHAAELRLHDWVARGLPTGGGSGRSSGVADPTCGALGLSDRERGHATRIDWAQRDRDDFEHHASMAAFHVKALAEVVAGAKPVPAVPDAPDYPCGNVACNHICTGKGNDRIVKPAGSDVGLCPRCRKHWERHKRNWPKNREGLDVRGSLAPLKANGAA